MWEKEGQGGGVGAGPGKRGQAAIQCLISHDCECGKGADDNAILNSPANPATMATMRPQIAQGEKREDREGRRVKRGEGTVVRLGSSVP